MMQQRHHAVSADAYQTLHVQHVTTSTVIVASQTHAEPSTAAHSPSPLASAFLICDLACVRRTCVAQPAGCNLEDHQPRKSRFQQLRAVAMLLNKSASAMNGGAQVPRTAKCTAAVDGLHALLDLTSVYGCAAAPLFLWCQTGGVQGLCWW